MPVLFISHGAPDILVKQDPLISQWRHQAEILPLPKHILVISAHWETPDFMLSANTHQKTIHDFSGFSPQLQHYHYRAACSMDFADTLAADIECGLLHQRGLDHGAWIPLMAMYPKANIPVTQLSIAPAQGCETHFRLGRQLANLRKQGVLIITSGAIVHNLAELSWQDTYAAPDSWADDFMLAFQDCVSRSQWQKLFFPQALVFGERAVPTLDHYLPFLVAAGAANGDNVKPFCNEWRFGNLAMHSYCFQTS